MLRRQLPVHSPVRLRSLAAGLGALAGDGQRAESRVRAWLDRTFAARRAVLLDGGTSALALGIRAALAGRPPGERLVALPAYGCFDLATAVDGSGAAAILYDLDPATLGPRWDSLERALEHGAGAVVVAHLYGIPVDLDRVQALAAGHDAFVIEDAAQGAGGRWRGRPLGAVGSFGVLSFGRGKGITGGGGGALLANDEAALRALDDAGLSEPPGGGGAAAWVKTLAQWLLARPAIYGVPASLPFLGLGETHYRSATPPTGMARSQLGVLSDTIGLADRESACRRATAGRLEGALRAVAGVKTITPPAGGEPGYLRLPVLVDPAARPAWLLAGRAHGVMPGYPRPLHRLPGFGDGPNVRLAGEPLPGAERLAAALVTVPTHGRVTARDLAALSALRPPLSAPGGSTAG